MSQNGRNESTSGVGVAERIDEIHQGGPNPLYHDKRGRFRLGNPGGGRAPKVVERAYLVAVTSRWTPEDVVQLIEDSIRIGKANKSARHLLQAATLILEYAIGKPVAKSITTHAPWEALMYREDDTRTVDSDVVDAKDD